MSEFENFEADFTDEGIGEVDPAADFLAREQDELAGLGDDIIESFDPPVTNNQSLFTDNDDPIDLGMGDDEFPPAQLNGPQEPPSTLGLSTPRLPREEPEKIRKWREEQQTRLEEKDREEELKKGELKETAKKELEDWYSRYKEQIEKSKQANREASRNAEKEWVAERDAESPGQEWERIAKLCDFNPKSSRNSKDTSRMRSIILQLKQTPLNRKA